MEPIDLKVVITQAARGIVAVPEYKTAGAAGFDLQAACQRKLQLQPGDRMLIPTGLYMAIPEGYEGQIRPRSGLALNKGITVLNAPATIDSDYRGEVGVVLLNTSGALFQINPGDRIAQMVIAPVTRLPILALDSLDDLNETARGSGGFGSTGTA